MRCCLHIAFIICYGNESCTKRREACTHGNLPTVCCCAIIPGCRFAVKQPALDFQEHQPEQEQEGEQLQEAGAAPGQAGKVRQTVRRSICITDINILNKKIKRKPFLICVFRKI